MLGNKNSVPTSKEISRLEEHEVCQAIVKWPHKHGPPDNRNNLLFTNLDLFEEIVLKQHIHNKTLSKQNFSLVTVLDLSNFVDTPCVGSLIVAVIFESYNNYDGISTFFKTP